MRQIGFCLVWLAAIAGSLRAQSSNGYVFFAPGGATCCGYTAMTLQMGAGGEAVIWNGIGAGAELGVAGQRSDFGGTVAGVFSPNGYYHFLRGKDLKLDPFVTGGYTLLFRSGSANLFNFGGGVNYWFHRRLGARLEFRDHVYTGDGTLHYWGIRVGLAFR
ncbi:MAG TPA: hypothetical protein VG672_25205 [Bryobacteraceae bacterium]|nr:hypothetical protein [Bryobacteraceae bacterium]